MKPGDLLYTVYEDDWDRRSIKLTIETVVIRSVGPKRVMIDGIDGGRLGLAFHCSTRLTIKEVERYGGSAHEAWQKYADLIASRIDEGERDLARWRQLHRRAMKETEKSQ